MNTLKMKSWSKKGPLCMLLLRFLSTQLSQFLYSANYITYMGNSSAYASSFGNQTALKPADQICHPE